MEVHNNISIDERDYIIDGSIKIFTQHFVENENSFATACFHLDKGRKSRYPSEGIEVVVGEKVGCYEGEEYEEEVFKTNNTKIDLVIIERWNT